MQIKIRICGHTSAKKGGGEVRWPFNVLYAVEHQRTKLAAISRSGFNFAEDVATSAACASGEGLNVEALAAITERCFIPHIGGPDVWDIQRIVLVRIGR